MKIYILVFALCTHSILFAHNLSFIENLPYGFYNPNYKYALAADCDACGCSANGGSMGFSSMISQNFIGLRYMYQTYRSRDGVFNDSPWIEENFNTLQAWGRIPISARVEIMALVPYHFNNRKKTEGDENIQGLGDITVMGFYTLLKPKNDSIPTRHKLQVGAGIKMPTGRYDSQNNGSINPSFQLGTGSWDYSLAVEYVIKHKKLGLDAMGNYIVKAKNNKEYKFGDQINYGATFFYTTAINSLMLVPQIGMAGEVYRANEDFGEEVPLTEGDILFAKAGLEMGLNRFSIGVNGMLPLSQNLTGGRVESRYRWGINLNYSL